MIVLVIFLLAAMFLGCILPLTARYRIEFYGGLAVFLLASANLIVLGYLTGVLS